MITTEKNKKQRGLTYFHFACDLSSHFIMKKKTSSSFPISICAIAHRGLLLIGGFLVDWIHQNETATFDLYERSDPVQKAFHVYSVTGIAQTFLGYVLCFTSSVQRDERSRDTRRLDDSAKINWWLPSPQSTFEKRRGVRFEREIP